MASHCSTNGAELLRQISSTSAWFEGQVASDDEPHRKTWPNCQGRLEVEIAANDLLTEGAVIATWA